jgi:hypothetical protein
VQGPGGRHYVWPERKPHELYVPSVTTILGRGIPKEALAPWNAKMVATFAVEHKDEWIGLPDEAAIDMLKRSPYRTTDRSARAGTIVHNAVEMYASGIEHSIPKDKGLANQYKGTLAFLKDFNVKVKFTEFTCFSREHEYAGTSDVLGGVTLPASLGLKPRKRTAIIDYKTGKRIYDEHPIQLNAYAFADFFAISGDTNEHPMPAIDALIVVRPKKRGGYEAKVYEPSQELHDLFLAAKVVAQRGEVLEHAAIGRVLTGPDEGVE